MTYQKDFLSLTKGNGKLFYQMAGYFECHDQEKIIQEIGYNSEEDALFPTGSIFCKQGAGFYVPYELNELAKTNLDHARHRLIDILNNYQGYRKCLLIVVFDAYKIKKNIGSIEKNDNIYVVYTKEAQTADNYIEKVTHDLSQKYRVYVATSDALEQIIVSSRGAMRISAREFELLVKETHLHEIEEFQRKNKQMKNYLLEDLKKN